MKTETIEYCREAGPFQAITASLPCYIIGATREVIAEVEDPDVAEYLADALNEGRRPMGNLPSARRSPPADLGAAPRRRNPAGNTKRKVKL